MLHIATALFRYENIPKIYTSIPKNDDITWHIAKTNRREELDHGFLKSDHRIKVYEINCDDRDIIEKRNAIFDNIKDGHFHLLDDDTIFHPAMYEASKKHKNFSGMIIGKQLSKDMQVRLNENYPMLGHIDAGNVLCHSSILNHVRWQDRLPGDYIDRRDFVFWDNCFKIFGKHLTMLIPDVISIYNKLS